MAQRVPRRRVLEENLGRAAGIRLGSISDDSITEFLSLWPASWPCLRPSVWAAFGPRFGPRIPVARRLVRSAGVYLSGLSFGPRLVLVRPCYGHGSAVARREDCLRHLVVPLATFGELRLASLRL